MYTVMFGIIAGMPTGGVPQALFYLAGTAVGLLCRLHQQDLGHLTANSAIFSKVYFPRLAMPVSTMLSALINFLCSSSCFSPCCCSLWPKAKFRPTGR